MKNKQNQATKNSFGPVAIRRITKFRDEIYNSGNWMDAADIYFVHLRRVYRILRKISTDNKIAMDLLKSEERLTENIKIRDHFDHSEKFNKEDFEVKDEESLNQISKNCPINFGKTAKVNIGLCLFGNLFVSGNYRWDLIKDHEKYCKLISRIGEIIDQ